MIPYENKLLNYIIPAIFPLNTILIPTEHFLEGEQRPSAESPLPCQHPSRQPNATSGPLRLAPCQIAPHGDPVHKRRNLRRRSFWRWVWLAEGQYRHLKVSLSFRRFICCLSFPTLWCSFYFLLSLLSAEEVVTRNIWECLYRIVFCVWEFAFV